MVATKTNKSKKQKAKIEPVLPKEVKVTVNKRVFSKAIKGQYANCSTWDQDNILAAINIRVKGNKLVLVSTNGNRLLETKLDILEQVEDSVSININGKLLYNLKFLKWDCPVIDNLELDIKPDGLSITDLGNNISYRLPITEGIYPKYEQLMPDKNKDYQLYGLNSEFLKRCADEAAVNPRTTTVKLYVNKDKFKPLLLEAESNEGMETRAILMPVRIREEKE
ncbi:MAG: hypothetical protein A2287_04740 [Candidatus Melainabacteria bacterium RIFOXYA12_FULL_32_12]|nr:MAG: hypothetical protein A2287_04740 [Candidatus Melainabacteria bacterium RIFOXYA12_FULL_32_12]